ncbi:alpha/beta hydrolase [Eupransor demetentiae]|uniref:Acetyl esterase/lipase (Aes) n=1 Tax=Eupransor demetentiae TaxID=3109584 RepID=A0ABP0ET26_9LACO|nr:Acetyl esterase/lipase (Aes) [Lactobacillaceae bacterium LMG 33000]
MKKSSILLGSIGAVGGLLGTSLGAGKLYAMKQKRSLRSLGVEKFLETFQYGPDVFDEETMKKQYKLSELPYDLPKAVTKRYGFRWMNKKAQIIDRPNKSEFVDHTIFYLHGGSYWADPNNFQFKAVATIADKTDARVVMPVYPKAPAHHAEEVINMVVKAYATLVKTAEPKDITILGDSAGGGLALSLWEKIRELDLPRPENIILFSPWLDLTMENPALVESQKYDSMLNAKVLRVQGEMYAGDLKVTDPLVSPLKGDLYDLPKITIFSGTHDLLYPDAEKFTKLAQENKQDVVLKTFESQGHDFAFLPIPEARKALKEASDIILNQ